MDNYDRIDGGANRQLALWTDSGLLDRQLALWTTDSPAVQDDSAADAPGATVLTLPLPRPNAGRTPAIELARRLATAPGLVRPGASRWDDSRTPIHPLSLENAFADPVLLRDLGARGARFARELGVDVVVGAETAGVPLAASVALAGGLPFAFVRKPGYRGHEVDEPPVRGAQVAGRRVLLVDDAVASGAAVERFTAALAGAGAEVVGVFVLVDMREVAETVTPAAAALRTESVSTYLQVLELATADGVLDPTVHKLTVDAVVNRWAADDPRWDLLPAAA